MWRQFPRQIASDLSRFHHRRIAEWHSGEMSSYELLELVEHLPETGAYKAALRRGGYTVDQAMIAELFNETARFRASYHSAHGSKYEPPEMTDPAVLVAKAEAEAAHALDREEVEAELTRGF